MSDALFDGIPEVRTEAERISHNNTERRRIVRRLAIAAVEKAWRPAVEAEVARILPAELERIATEAIREASTFALRRILEEKVAVAARETLEVVVRVKEAK